MKPYLPSSSPEGEEAVLHCIFKQHHFQIGYE